MKHEDEDRSERKERSIKTELRVAAPFKIPWMPSSANDSAAPAYLVAISTMISEMRILL